MLNLGETIVMVPVCPSMFFLGMPIIQGPDQFLPSHLRAVFAVSYLEVWGNVFTQRVDLFPLNIKAIDFPRSVFFSCKCHLLHVHTSIMDPWPCPSRTHGVWRSNAILLLFWEIRSFVSDTGIYIYCQHPQNWKVNLLVCKQGKSLRLWTVHASKCTALSTVCKKWIILRLGTLITTGYDFPDSCILEILIKSKLDFYLKQKQ